MYVISGDYKRAITEAFRAISDNPPDNLPSIIEAGDILSQYGNNKDLGFGLLERAVSMAPGNQYIALRYSQRLMTAGRFDEAELKLVQLSQKYPQWIDPVIVLSKLHILQHKEALATTELIALINNTNVDSHQAEHISLLLAKLGRLNDGFVLFQKAIVAEPQKCFYADYCRNWLAKSPGSYDTVLAMVKTNLISNASTPDVAKQLNLEIQHGALLLLLGRAQDAQASLRQAINTHPNNFDLHVLLAAAYSILGQTEESKTAFKRAVDNYQLGL